MKWRNAVVLAAGTVSLGIATFFGIQNLPTQAELRVQLNERTKAYVNTHLEEIISAQEKKLGIKHFGKPKIVYMASFANDTDSVYFRGKYYPTDDNLHLSLKRLATPELTLSNILAIMMIPEQVWNVKETLDHELGHFYADKLYESLGCGDWPPPITMGDLDVFGTRLVSEGIADYFKRTMNGDTDDTFEDGEFPQTVLELINTMARCKKGITRRPLYEGGYHLVKPIIDKHGKRGIAYLLLNPPTTTNDLLNLPTYQKAVLKTLSQQSQQPE